MSELDSEVYVPYLALAEAIIQSDNSPELYLLSLFPNATKEQIASFILYSIGRYHAGMIQGLEISDYCDPIGLMDAYQAGINEGIELRD
jgi:hypothetical protein